MINNDLGVSPKSTHRSRKGAKSPNPSHSQQMDGRGPSVEQSEPDMRAAATSKQRRSNRSNRGRNRNYHQQNFQAQSQAAGGGSLQGQIAVSSLKRPDGSWDLGKLAETALRKYNLATEYPRDVKDQVADIMAQIRPSPDVYNHPEAAKKPWVRDLTNVPFVSVDNGTLWTEMDKEKLAKDPEANVSSRDIDQLQYAKKLPNGDIHVMVAVSDVSAFVEKGSALDRFMDKNAASVYTPDRVFNLIPPELAEDIVSLNPREERFATVVEYTVTPDGKLKDENVSKAIVKSRTKLDYSSVGGWLQNEVGPSPAMVAQGDELLDGLKIQAEASARLEKAQDMKGALEFDSTEMRIITEDGKAIGMEESKKNVATEMVENFMVTTNGVMSRFLRDKGYPTLERTVKEPEKWPEIVDLAGDLGYKLPNRPDAKALADFMAAEKAKNPDKADELSISVIKLIGRGEYQAVGPNDELPGHFPLGVKNYTQSTASIRRGGDRAPARMANAALAGEPSPYSERELQAMAENINEKDQLIKKAERLANKKVTATMLEDRVGETFKAVVTGVKGDQAWVRIGDPPVEGSLMDANGVRVGQRMTVKLTKVDPAKGWIDFHQV